MTTPTPHDLLFRYAFDDPDVGRAELRRVLPRALLDALDLSQLRLEPPGSIDAELGERIGDVHDRVKLAGRDAFVWFLTEHQSTGVQLMALRQLEQMTRRWTGHVRTSARRPRRLPLILPIVVSHARPRWRAPRRFRDLYAAPAQLRALDGLLDFSFVVDDLMATSDDAIERSSTSDVLTAVLWSLRSRGQVPEARSPAWAALLGRMQRSGRGDAAAAVMRYHWERSRSGAPVVVRAAMTVDPELKEVGMRYLDRVRKKSHEEGREEGQRVMLLKQITLKFGAPSAEVAARVGAASVAELDRATERILTADHVDALFAD